MPSSLGKSNRTSQVLEGRRDLARNKVERINGWSDQAVEVARDLTSGELVQQTSSVWAVDRSLKGTVLDGAKVDGIKATIGSVATEQNRVLKIHGNNLGGDIEVGVGADTVGPVVRDALAACEAPGTVTVLLGTEERRDGLEVRSIVVVAVRHKLVQEGSGSVKKKGQRTKEEVGVLLKRLSVALQAVLGQILTVEVALAGVLHHAEEGAVERVVVSISKEVVISGQGGVGLELVVAVETRLGSCEHRAERGSGCGVAANGKLLGNKITISEGETKSGEKCGQVISNVVNVLLSIYKLVECGNTIVRKELQESVRISRKEVDGLTL